MASYIQSLQTWRQICREIWIPCHLQILLGEIVEALHLPQDIQANSGIEIEPMSRLIVGKLDPRYHGFNLVLPTSLVCSESRQAK